MAIPLLVSALLIIRPQIPFVDEIANLCEVDPKLHILVPSVENPFAKLRAPLLSRQLDCVLISQL